MSAGADARVLPLAPLTADGFGPFGEVVEITGKRALTINQGFAQRVDALASIDCASEGGRVNLSIFGARTRPQPITIALMERHPLGSQMFYPLQNAPWLVVVCADPADAASYRAFHARGDQGVNYRAGTWHHPLLVLRDDERFIVVDRTGPGNNLDEFHLAGDALLRVQYQGNSQ